jgi:hypothetical protein
MNKIQTASGAILMWGFLAVLGSDMSSRMNHMDREPQSNPASVSCQSNEQGLFQMKNDHGTWIGDIKGWDASTKQLCDKLAAVTKNGLVCSWNGYSYQAYDIETGQALGLKEPQNGWGKADDCAQHIGEQLDDSPFMCTWNGKSYSPYDKPTGTRLSDELNGWDTNVGCVKNALGSSTDQSVCTWSKGAYWLYARKDFILGGKYKDVNDCQATERLFFAPLKEREAAVDELKTLPQNYHEAFSPPEAGEQVGFAWKDCADPKKSYFLVKNQDGYVVPECVPDTLYSWGGAAKVEWYRDHLSDKPWPEQLERSLYTTSSAAATFGYGPIPMRFKIKKGTRFKFFANASPYQCDDYVKKNLVNKDELKNTVIVRYELRDSGLAFLDYIICSANVIDSWSYGTPENYDEILADVNWMSSKDFKLWEGYSKQSGHDDFIGNDIDGDGMGTDFSQKTLQRRMNFLWFVAHHQLGHVYFPPGSSAKREEHFATSRPIYFNPK